MIFFQPKRSAHPLVKFKCDPCEPIAIDEIPFDKYELEPSPLTQYILERRQPNVAWQVNEQRNKRIAKGIIVNSFHLFK